MVVLVDVIALVVLWRMKKHRAPFGPVFVFSLIFIVFFGLHLFGMGGKEGLGDMIYYEFLGGLFSLAFFFLVFILLLRIVLVREIQKKPLFMVALFINLLYGMFFITTLLEVWGPGFKLNG